MGGWPDGGGGLNLNIVIAQLRLSRSIVLNSYIRDEERSEIALLISGTNRINLD